jgi:hypothetical protein
MGYSGRPFPGNGVAHWQVRRLSHDGRQLGRVFTCQLRQVEAALEAWSTPMPAVPELVAPAKRREELEALAAAKRPAFASSSPGADFAEQVRGWAKPEPYMEELMTDLAELAPERIAYWFPFGPNGARKVRVILNTYAGLGSRSPSLYVTSKRNTLELGLDQLIEINHAHQWRSLRWRWDRRVPVPAPEQRWGLPANDERCARWLTLVDEGRFAEALALYAIEWDDDVARKLTGQRPPGSLNPHLEEWASELREVVWSLAPWKLDAGLGARQGANLHLLSHQVGVHKEFLGVLRKSNGFRLHMECTMQNGTLAEHLYKRDVEHDLARFGLAKPEIPAAPAPVANNASANKAPRKPSGKAEARARALQAKWEEGLVMLFQQAEGHVDHAVIHARKRAEALVLPIVLRELRSPHPKVIAYVMRAAGRLLLPVADEALACLSHPSVSVVAAAMDTLCRLRHAPALPAIADCVYERPEVRVFGAATLRSWGDRPTDALSRHLEASVEKLRAAAAIAIGIYKSRAHPGALLKLLPSDTPLVAGAALRALELLDVPAAKIAASLDARPDAAQARAARDHWAEVKTIDA